MRYFGVGRLSEDSVAVCGFVGISRLLSWKLGENLENSGFLEKVEIMHSSLLSSLVVGLLAIIPLPVEASWSKPFYHLPRQSNTTASNTTYTSTITTPATELLILPLGDSITFGYGSTTGNGYRQDLLTLLQSTYQNTSTSSNTTQYNNITYIGSLLSGTMTNNANEGHSGATIQEIQTNGTKYINTLKVLPNIILIMAGTNDMNIPVQPTTAPSRLATLLDIIISLCPDSTILVATVVPSLSTATESNIQTYNAAIPKIVSNLVGGGAKVELVNMTAFVSTEELYDGLHPDDVGYQGMAQAWFDGIERAVGKGWVVESGMGNGTGSLVATSVVGALTATAKATGSATATGKKSDGMRRESSSSGGWGFLMLGWAMVAWLSGVGYVLL